MAKSAQAPKTAVHRTLVLAATILGSGMAILDGSAVNVALPQLQKSLDAGASGIEWVVTAYMLTLSAFVLIGGAAGDRYGRRLVFICGAVLFALASLGCALAPSLEVLTAARAVQGIGAALLTPASLAILSASFTDEHRGGAIGAWAGIGALAAAIGPVLGGWLTQAVSWRAIFLINLPLAAVTVALALLFVPESKDPKPRPADWPGAALAVLGLAALTWGLTVAPERGLHDALVLAALGSGLLLSGAFVWRELTCGCPMAPPELFKSPTFTGANISTLLLYFALSGSLFFLPFALIPSRGMTPLEAGAALLPLSAIMGLFSPFAGRLAQRIGPRLQMSIGPVLAGGGLAWLSLAAGQGSYWTSVFPGACLLAAGLTTTVAPLTDAVMKAAGPDDAGIASGVNNAIARLAGLLAVAMLGVVFSLAFQHALGGQGDAHKLLGEAMTGKLSLQGRTGEAFRHAFTVVMLACAACAALAGGVSFLTIGREKARG
jgi:EmrB/QacA subfamily drug resistance transporter